jgi:hypothetical protein
MYTFLGLAMFPMQLPLVDLCNTAVEYLRIGAELIAARPLGHSPKPS